MAAQTKTMHQIRQILDLHHRGHGSKKIVKLTGTARNTVRTYLREHGARQSAVMHFQHRPGEQLMIDYTGDKMHWVDPVAAWHDYIAEPTLADVILDRLLANAHRFELKGESLRKKTTTKTQ